MVDRGSFSNMMGDLSFVDDRVLSYAPIQGNNFLPPDFQPNSWSVICGRGKDCFEHVGNKRFRILCEINLPKYTTATTKIEKSLIVMSIIDAVREGSGFGGFIKQDPDNQRWFEVPDAVAREKVGQQLREMLLQKNPDKIEKRKERRRRNLAKLKQRKKAGTQQQQQTAGLSAVASLQSSISAALQPLLKMPPQLLQHHEAAAATETVARRSNSMCSQGSSSSVDTDQSPLGTCADSSFFFERNFFTVASGACTERGIVA